MLKDKLKKKINFKTGPKKDRSELGLIFQTRD